MLVITPSITQSTREEGTQGLIELLKFISTEWDRFENSKRSTMRDLTVPRDLTCILVNGELYTLAGPRSVWFMRTDKGYDRGQFYVSEAHDLCGKPFQLHLSWSGNPYEEVGLIKARQLGVPPVSRSFGSTGPRVRE